MDRESNSRTGGRNLRGIGTRRERLAAAFLEQHGVEITARNFRMGRVGEIDLIGYDGEELVFFEVKYRSRGGSGLPEESVTPAKQHTISRIARYYLQKEQISPDRPIRFDVVAVRPAEPDENGRLRAAIRWIRGAFDYCGPSVL